MRLKNQEREIEYAEIPLTQVTRTFSDTEISSYYKTYLTEFRNPERVSVEYLALNFDEIAKDVQVSDEELTKLYEEQKASLGTPERRKISHILIAPGDGSEAALKAAQDKATGIRNRILKGEDFAKLAQEVSSDALSGKAGGDLGFLNKEAQEESFTKAAEKLNSGEVSEPVKTSFGYHLIKVTELIPAKQKSFEEVKEELHKTAQRNAAETRFYEKGQKLAEQTFEHPGSLDTAAQALGLKIQQTVLFTREEGEGLAAEESVRKAAFSEDVLGGRNSEPVELGNEKAVVLRIKEHQQASDKPMAEVKDAIIAKLRDQESRAEAVKSSQELLKTVRDGKSLAEAAKNLGLKITKTGFVRRDNDKLPPELLRAAFTAGRPAAGKVSAGDATQPNGSQWVFSVTTVKDGPMAAADAKDQESASQFMTRSGSQREFGSFVERLRELADVKINNKDG
jgi:peptidyl-prolyl cis-trans isomerase D